jgi:CDP-diglyceride synthetase
MFRKRFITGLILICIFLFVLFFTNPVIFSICFSIIYLYASVEFTNLLGMKTSLGKSSYIFSTLMFMIVFLLIGNELLKIISYVYFMIWSIILVMLFNYPKINYNKKPILVLVSQGSIIISWYCLILLRENSIHYVLNLIFLVAICDTAAYLVGKNWGGIKIAKIISPNKTLEGSIAGIFTPVIIFFIIWFTYLKDILFIDFLILECAIIFVLVMSIFGDLFISMLKRIVNVKDSGNILPGHGGVLDRLDSYLAAIPIYTILLLYYIGV